MIRDLRARLNALAQAPPPAPQESKQPVCRSAGERSAEFAPYKELSVRGLQRMGIEMDAQTPLLFLDTETTGLSGGAGTLAFMVGMAWWEGEVLALEQLFLTDYDQETDMLRRVQARVESCGALVTFNGRAFDWPLLVSRMRLMRLPSPADRPHVDLLPHARRLWRSRLQSCTLQNIERAELGIQRDDDLPGSLAPERFFTALRTGQWTLLNDVLRHNAQDVKTMALLLHRLCQAMEDPLHLSDVRDIHSAGKTLIARGEIQEAEACFIKASASPLGTPARLSLAKLHLRQKRYVDAEKSYRMLLSASKRPEHYIALAILYEHRLRDLPKALEAARSALERTRPLGPTACAPLEHRIHRIEHKIRRKLECIIETVQPTDQEKRDDDEHNTSQMARMECVPSARSREDGKSGAEIRARIRPWHG